jgi:hypothetical protein
MAEKLREILCGDYIKTEFAHQILNDAGITHTLVPGKGFEFVYPCIKIFEKDANKALEILKSNVIFKGIENCPIIV